MNAIVKNIIRKNFREGGLTIEEIASSLGYTESAVEKVIYPNGREKKELVPTIVRIKKIKKEVQKEVKKEWKQEEARKSVEKKWADAGRKSWETRRQKALLQQIPIKEEKPDEKPPEPEPRPQPILETNTVLVTMNEENRNKVLSLLKEATEYMQVGFDNIQKAMELLNKS